MWNVLCVHRSRFGRMCVCAYACVRVNVCECRFVSALFAIRSRFWLYGRFEPLWILDRHRKWEWEQRSATLTNFTSQSQTTQTTARNLRSNRTYEAKIWMETCSRKWNWIASTRWRVERVRWIRWTSQRMNAREEWRRKKIMRLKLK